MRGEFPDPLEDGPVIGSQAWIRTTIERLQPPVLPLNDLEMKMVEDVGIAPTAARLQGGPEP